MHLINTFIIGLLISTNNVSAFSVHRVDFTWEDINTRDVLRWEGDMAVLREGSSMQELSCKIALDSEEVKVAINQFGIPKDWTSIKYTDSEDLAKKQKELQDKSLRHGIMMNEDDNQYIVDYAWVVNNSIPKVRHIAKTIRSAARKRGYRSKRELVGAFATFVQSLEYRIPPDHRVNDKGEEILTAGAMMPLDTLAKQWGDCDSKSMLFASLVRSINLVDVSFIVMDNHLFAAVQLAPTHDDHAIRHDRDGWVLIELTDSWPIGRVPQKHLHGIKNHLYTIVELD
jgi:hypothetical protein